VHWFKFKVIPFGKLVGIRFNFFRVGAAPGTGVLNSLAVAARAGCHYNKSAPSLLLRAVGETTGFAFIKRSIDIGVVVESTRIGRSPGGKADLLAELRHQKLFD
jgi:hypothetical protein